MHMLLEAVTSTATTLLGTWPVNSAPAGSVLDWGKVAGRGDAIGNATNGKYSEHAAAVAVSFLFDNESTLDGIDSLGSQSTNVNMPTRACDAILFCTRSHIMARIKNRLDTPTSSTNVQMQSIQSYDGMPRLIYELFLSYLMVCDTLHRVLSHRQERMLIQQQPQWSSVFCFTYADCAARLVDMTQTVSGYCFVFVLGIMVCIMCILGASG
jgi:hypothetical protein